MRRFEEDPGSAWYAAAAILLLVVFAVAIGWAALQYFGVTINCSAILSGLFFLGLLVVAIRPFMKIRK